MTLRIPSARSLKERRRVVKSLKERLQARLRVSAAEVGELNEAQHAELGVVVVANAAEQVDSVLGEAAQMANTIRDATLVGRHLEIVPFGSATDQSMRFGGDARDGIAEFATPLTIEPLHRGKSKKAKREKP